MRFIIAKRNAKKEIGKGIKNIALFFVEILISRWGNKKIILLSAAWGINNKTIGVNITRTKIAMSTATAACAVFPTRQLLEGLTKKVSKKLLLSSAEEIH